MSLTQRPFTSPRLSPQPGSPRRSAAPDTTAALHSSTPCSLCWSPPAHAACVVQVAMGRTKLAARSKLSADRAQHARRCVGRRQRRGRRTRRICQGWRERLTSGCGATASWSRRWCMRACMSAWSRCGGPSPPAPWWVLLAGLSHPAERSAVLRLLCGAVGSSPCRMVPPPQERHACRSRPGRRGCAGEGVHRG